MSDHSPNTPGSSVAGQSLSGSERTDLVTTVAPESCKSETEQQQLFVPPGPGPGVFPNGDLEDGAGSSASYSPAPRRANLFGEGAPSPTLDRREGSADRVNNHAAGAGGTSASPRQADGNGRTAAASSSSRNPGVGGGGVGGASASSSSKAKGGAAAHSPRDDAASAGLAKELREKHGLTVQYAKSSGTYTTSLGNLRKSASARSALEAYLTKAIADAASDPGAAAAARAVGTGAGAAPDDMSTAAAPADITAKLPNVVVGERVTLDAGIEERRAFLAQLRKEYAGHSALRGGEMNEEDEDVGDDEEDSDEVVSQQSDDSDTEAAQPLGGGSAARGGGGPRAAGTKRKMAGTLPKVAEELQEHGDQKAAEEDWEGSMKNRNWVRVQIHQVPFLVRLNMPLVSTSSEEKNNKSSDGVPLAVCAAFFSQKRPTDVEADKELLSRLSQAESTRNFAILILRSGRFSGAIFSSVDGRCLLHKTFRRYTVRAKAGGAQSTKDNTGKSIKSAGSTLRRYGEQQLENSMKTLFRDWEGDLRQCKGDVFVSGGHDQIATLLKCLPGESPAYKKLPIQVRKSTLEEVETLALQLRAVHFFPEQMEKKIAFAPGSMTAAALTPRSRAATGSTKASKQELRSTAPDRRLNQHLLQGTINQESDPRNQPADAEEEEQAYLSDEDPLFTPLHAAAKAGDAAEVERLLTAMCEGRVDNLSSVAPQCGPGSVLGSARLGGSTYANASSSNCNFPTGLPTGSSSSSAMPLGVTGGGGQEITPRGGNVGEPFTGGPTNNGGTNNPANAGAPASGSSSLAIPGLLAAGVGAPASASGSARGKRPGAAVGAAAGNTTTSARSPGVEWELESNSNWSAHAAAGGSDTTEFAGSSMVGGGAASAQDALLASSFPEQQWLQQNELLQHYNQQLTQDAIRTHQAAPLAIAVGAEAGMPGAPPDPLGGAGGATVPVQVTDGQKLVAIKQEIQRMGRAIGISLRDGKGRLPYYVAANQKVRDAFRHVRGKFPDELDWDSGQVPPGITEDTEAAKKQKEKDKKKQKKARQQENKAEKKQQEEQKRAEEEQKRKHEEELLKGPPCAWCGKGCGANANKWFRRLDYIYDTSDCVKAHQRQLAADAAAKRFGGGP